MLDERLQRNYEKSLLEQTKPDIVALDFSHFFDYSYWLQEGVFLSQEKTITDLEQETKDKVQVIYEQKQVEQVKEIKKEEFPDIIEILQKTGEDTMVDFSGLMISRGCKFIQSYGEIINSLLKMNTSNFDFFAEQNKIQGKIEPLQELSRQLYKITGSVEGINASKNIAKIAKLTDKKPEWNVNVNGQLIKPEIIEKRLWCDFIRFTPIEVEMIGNIPKKISLVAPMSGHYSSLLTRTIQNYLKKGIIVDLTDWNNAKHISVNDENFSVDAYTETVMDFMQTSGQDTNTVAICQAGPSTLAATAKLSEMKNKGELYKGKEIILPNSVQFIASPLHTKINPTIVNNLAMQNDLQWFIKNMIHTVPDGIGIGRKVYPGELQILCFIAPNIKMHIENFVKLFKDLRNGNIEEAEKQIIFYQEYFSCSSLDMTFYLETIEKIFHNSSLDGMVNGTFTYKGEKINLLEIQDVTIYTLEGSIDDITGLGQSSSLKNFLPDNIFRGNTLLDTGHYGAFVKTESADIIDEKLTEATMEKYFKKAT